MRQSLQPVDLHPKLGVIPPHREIAVRLSKRYAMKDVAWLFQSSVPAVYAWVATHSGINRRFDGEGRRHLTVRGISEHIARGEKTWDGEKVPMEVRERASILADRVGVALAAHSYGISRHILDKLRAQ